MHFDGYDVTEWQAVAGLLIAALTIWGAFYKYEKARQKIADEHVKRIASEVNANNNKQMVSLQLNLDNLGAAIKEFKQVVEGFRMTEQEHYTEHEKHLIKHDLKLQRDDDSLEDHENRIKDNEEDINYLKDKLRGDKE